jgi:hypothetical protein
MYTEIWQKCCRAVCSIDFFSSSNIKVMSISGFKAGSQIITDDMIYQVRDADSVQINFYQDDGTTPYASHKLSYANLMELLPAKDEFDNLGIVAIPNDFPEFSDVPTLHLCKSCEVRIGQSIAVIGYQVEHHNLALKPGTISSHYKNSKGLSFIQYDGTIKPGNSGAPLLDYQTGSVLGVVLNKEMGFVKSYKELNEIIDTNLKFLKEQEGKANLFDVDLAQVLSANQKQIKHILREFFLNATVRVGFALEIGHVVECLESKSDIDIDSGCACD